MKKFIIYILMLFSFTSVKAMNVNIPQKVYPGNNFQVTVGGTFASAIVKINFNGGLSKAMIDNPSRIDDYYQSHTFTLKAPSKVGSYNINIILEQTFSGETMKTETRNVVLNVIAYPESKPTPKPNIPSNNKPKTQYGNKKEPKAKVPASKHAENPVETTDNKIIVKINDEDYEYVSALPYEGYTLAKEKIGDKEVEVYKKDDKYLLKVQKDSKEYYALYDKEYKLVPLIDEKIITNINQDIKSPSIKKEDILINGINVKALALKEHENLYLVSLLDDKKIYLYDAKNKRISPFIKLKEETKENKQEEGLLAFIGINSKKSFITVMSLLLLLLGHFIFDIIYISKKNSKANTLN